MTNFRLAWTLCHSLYEKHPDILHGKEKEYIVKNLDRFKICSQETKDSTFVNDSPYYWKEILIQEKE